MLGTDSSEPSGADVISALLLLSVVFLVGFVAGALATLFEVAWGIA